MITLRWDELTPGQQVRCQFLTGDITGKVVAGTKRPDSLYVQDGGDFFPVYAMHKATRITLLWTPRPPEPQGIGAVVETVEEPTQQYVSVALPLQDPDPRQLNRSTGDRWSPTTGPPGRISWTGIPDNIIIRTHGWTP